MNNYTLKQIEAAANKLYTQAERTNPEDLIADLTKSDWKPRDGQWMINGVEDVYVFTSVDIDTGGWRCIDAAGDECIGSPSEFRPLTTKEAGPECMQHLLDVLEEIRVSDCNYHGNVWNVTTATNVLTKHQELIK